VSAAPLAAASIAQVHRATLRGGADVVLKVQHRGVRQVVLQDLENAAYLCEYVAAQKPEHDFRELLREWIDETKRELDFEREALNTDLVGDALRSAGCACTVPGVIRSGRVRPTARLLPLEFVDGVKPNDARALSRLEVDVDELLGDISEAFATNILIDGRFNADPHPGNILVRKSDGRPVLLDFGLTKVLPEPSRLGIARLVLAAAESDAAGVVAAVRAVGVLVDIPTPFGTYRAQLKPDQVTGVTRTPLQSFVAEAFPVGSHVLAEVLDVDAASEVTACHLSTRNLEEALGEMSTDRDALFARARARRAAQPPPRSRAERREVAKAAEHGLAEPYIEALEHHHVRAG